MKTKAAICLAALVGLNAVAFAQTPAVDAPTAAASFVGLGGKVLGSATMLETAHGVVIRAELEGLEPGEHSLHIHEKGVCDPAVKFESAGGHFNPASGQHGFMVEHGPHAGDMPNQFVGEDGKLSVNLINTAIRIGNADVENKSVASVIDEDGSAIVIHAGADDYKSQPAGNAGDRIACAVIEVAPK